MKFFRFLAFLFLGAAAFAEVPIVSGEYFGEIGCSHCDIFLNVQKAEMEKRLGVRIELKTYDILKTEEYALCVRMLERRGMKFRAFPVLFIGENVYQGNSAIERNLETEIEFFLKHGSYRTRVLDAADIGGFSARAAPVFLAGLLDGVNPCAFSTLLFFLSFLGLRKKSRNAVLAVGSVFILSVFSVYFLMGIGLLAGLHALAGYRWLAAALNVVVSFLSVLLGIFSVRDALRARAGRPEDSSLKLPAALTKANHFVIRTFASQGALIAGAAFIGAAVSVLELACTGQIYFPTLAYINRTAPTSGSLFLLLVYNAAFVMPLLTVFLVFFFGSTHGRISAWYRGRLFQVRLGTALFFFLMAVLIWIV